ncbi:MAG: PspC domain-containing protein [Propionibacteriaceae bacterium]
MSTHYPPRRLERSRTDRVLGGVCGGAASYLNMDPTLVRILTAVLSIVFPVTIVAYIVLLFALPEQQLTPGPRPQVQPQGMDPVWGPSGAPWQQSETAAPQGRTESDFAPAPPSPHGGSAAPAPRSWEATGPDASAPQPTTIGGVADYDWVDGAASKGRVDAADVEGDTTADETTTYR